MSADQWAAVNELYDLLNPLAKVSEEMQSQQCNAVGMCAKVFDATVGRLNDFKTERSDVKSVRQCIAEGLTNRRLTTASGVTLLAAYLDPRFKWLTGVAAEQQTECMQTINAMYEAMKSKSRAEVSARPCTT